VRHKVECLRAAEREVGEAGRYASAERASRFMRLALRYATLGSRPTIVAVMGEVGCGKSTLAARLADTLGLALFSSDVTRKRLAGLPLQRRPSDAVRARLYAPAMSRRVYATLLASARSAARAEHSLVIDATFSRRADRADLRKFANRLGAAVHFVELTTPAAVRRRRLAERARSGSVSDARLSDFTLLSARYEPPSELPAAVHLHLRSRPTAAATLAAALLALAEKRGLSPFSEK
jgi:hypothetical protein